MMSKKIKDYILKLLKLQESSLTSLCQQSNNFCRAFEEDRKTCRESIKEVEKL